MPLTLADIETLFTQHGHTQYSGEPVTQLEHALQTAQLAEQAGADDELVTAALVHDLGHLMVHYGATPSMNNIDDLHQFVALPFLRGVFSDRVLACIQLHVDAKRYLCATRPDYQAALSPDSQRSLALQGGVFTAMGAEAFAMHPHAQDAIALRLWDDLAKEAALPTPSLGYYLSKASHCLLA